MRAEELKGHLNAMLLAALEDGPRHGYAVMEGLRQSTGGRLDLPTGTIYPALRRLEQAGLIAGSWSVVGGRRRREYRLIAAGRRALAGRRAGLLKDSQRRAGGRVMPEPRVIREYLAVLSTQLPAPAVEELADGLAETHQSYLRKGLATDLAAEAAVSEFGEPHLIVAEFARVNPARRAARRLLVAGPAVAGCWAAALITGRAWDWLLPPPARILPGLALITVISLLAAAAFGRPYPFAARAGAAGCIGTVLLDTVMVIGVALAIPALTWVTIGAMAASTARIAFSGRTLRPILAS